MRRLLMMVLFAAAVLAATLPAPAQSRRALAVRPMTGPLAGHTFYGNCRALLIGISEYRHLPRDRWLDYADRDATELRNLLVRSYGFLPENVTLLLNEQATRENIRAALAELADPDRVKPEDATLIFFSGHGQVVTLQNGGKAGFLIPYDANVDLARPDNPAPYLRSCIRMETLGTELEVCPSRHWLVIADACFGGLLGRGRNLEAPAPTPELVREYLARPARQVLTAGSADQEVIEVGRLGHGVFTAKLLEELRAKAANPDQALLASSLAASLKVDVGNVTGGKQTPELSHLDGTRGEFIFLTTPPQAVPGLPAVDPLPRQPAPENRPRVEPPRPRPDPGSLRAGQVLVNPVDGAEMVYVPPGAFLMGSEEGADHEKPVRRVRITRGFWLYKTEVTNAQYGRFLEATGHRKPSYWDDARFNAPEQPVVGVSWEDAVKYCEWAGARLPTEAEWEYAARGTDGRKYPWGNQEPDVSRAIFDLDLGSGRPGPVGRLAGGASPFGALDMAGNVWEWCADRYGPYPAGEQADPAGPVVGEARVLRGGSWSGAPAALRASYRNRVTPDFRYYFNGFRPARTTP